MVTWRSSGVFAPATALAAALGAEGLPDRVPSPEPSTYLRRALNEAVRDGLVRKIGEDQHRVAFAVVREAADVTLTHWDGQQVEGVTLLKASGEVVFARGSALGDRVRSAVADKRGGLVGSEVAALFAGILHARADAVRLRPGGGVLFVPQERVGVLDALERVADAVSGLRGMCYYRFEVYAGSRTMGDVYRLFRDEVAAEYERVRAFVSEAVGREKTTPGFYRSREREVLRLVARVRRLEDVLGRAMTTERQRLSLYRRYLEDRYKAEEARRLGLRRVRRRERERTQRARA